LDGEIKKLQKAIRREATIDELEQFTPALTDAIQALDHSTAAPQAVAAQQTQMQPDPPPETIVGDDRVRVILAALLAELRRDPELLDQVDALDSKLAASMTPDQLPEVLSSLTEIVGRRIQRIERSKREIEVLLSQMVGKLDEIGQFVAEQSQNQNQSQASNETLSTQLVGEMKAMGESVESAGDLQQIRTQVRSRLDSIDRRLQEFRQREATRASAMRTRNEQMQARVATLEAEANRLHGQLKDERRLSTIDVLTKIPNRLAYDKRIEEELSRWQRFNQPTCIAVWDVDHFKRINDTCGHRAGDRVLRTVAECLAGRIRGTDFVARYGGEEFVMILSGTRLDDAVRLVNEMRVAISEIGFHFRGTALAVTISSGVTALLVGDSASAAFDRADKAMYQAKESGRNRCVSI
jgi:diguanylate cyclase